MLTIAPNIHIPAAELAFTFARSGGPGGQNVNKVNSKAMLRWRITTSPSLSEAVRARSLAKFGHRLTADGDVIITSQKYRDQERNIADCLAKLQAMIEAVAVPPTRRRPTNPTFASKVRSLESKQENSRKKERRRPPRLED